MPRINSAVGLVGLPNVGKSSLFNALVGQQLAFTANYPFATIKPNIALVQVPDPRLDRLAALAKSKRTIRDVIEVHDIAGLVRGASKGQGLGNEFLGHIRSVDAIIHVIELINLELALADLASVEKRLLKSRTGPDRVELEKARDDLLNKRPATLPGMLSSKPQLLALISDEPKPSPLAAKVMSAVSTPAIVVCALLEAQLAAESDVQARNEMMEAFGVDPADTALNRLSQAISKLLNRSVFFTVGPEEARAWAFAQGERAQDCASHIHSDIARGFVAAEVKADYDAPVRLEGRDYGMKNGDIVHFRFKV